MTDKGHSKAGNKSAQQIAELTEALQRERADAVNLRRRHEAEMAGMRGQVKAGVISQLLPVIDNFERSLAHVPKDLQDDNFVKGINGIIKQFEKTLNDLGVEKIQTVGQRFDPNLHEAVGVDGEESGGQEVVSQEMQAGYRLGDAVIRPAMVRVKYQTKN